LLTRSASIGHNGGEIDISIAPLPADCRPSVAASGNWLQLASDGVRANVFRFSAAPNTSPMPRTAKVIAGNQSLVVTQEGLVRTRLAVSPGRVIVGLSPKVARTKQEIAIWTDDPSSAPAVTATASWIQVKPLRSKKPGTSRFELIIDAPPTASADRREAAIIVSADGAAPLTIPVIVEGSSRR
jgi:hypothetical protein